MSFSRISTQVRLLKGRTASLAYGLGADISYFLMVKDRSPILTNLVFISVKFLLVRTTFCR